MGTSRVIIASNPGDIRINNFNKEIVVKLELPGADVGARWLLLGRVMMRNNDGDFQVGEAKLVHDANVELDTVKGPINAEDIVCWVLTAGLISKDHQTVTLECSTYKGIAYEGTIVALSVDDIQTQ
jgi:hypothetical protein